MMNAVVWRFLEALDDEPSPLPEAAVGEVEDIEDRVEEKLEEEDDDGDESRAAVGRRCRLWMMI